MVVLEVLVEDRGDLFAIEADGHQGLLVVMGGNVDNKQVAASHGGVEDALGSMSPPTLTFVP